MRIEQRHNGEYLVDVEGDMNDCMERSPQLGLLCTRHLNGEHVSGGHMTSDGAIRVVVRWPMERSEE
jgi:hypothetical protein